MFINHKLKAIFIHNPKCGGVYVREILTNIYGFKEVTNKKHKKYADFFNTEEFTSSNTWLDTDKHTIRKLGKYRFFYSHQNVNTKWFEEYFVFTFVRDPYKKVISAYAYVKENLRTKEDGIKIRDSIENPALFENFNTFIANYKRLNNISYFHGFITQYNQLCDFSGNLQYNFIGRCENLSEDFNEVLRKIGITEYKHLEIGKMNETKKRKLEFEYNEDSFLFVSQFFKKDFEIFGYEKFSNYKEFQKFYSK
jgi:hypothetical protein